MTAFGAARFARAVRGKLPGTNEVFPQYRSVEKNSKAQKSTALFLRATKWKAYCLLWSRQQPLSDPRSQPPVQLLRRQKSAEAYSFWDPLRSTRSRC